MSLRNCCDTELLCGHTLFEGVVFVGIASIALSTIMFVSSLLSLVAVSNQEIIKEKPVMGMNLIFALVSLSISAYQFIISLFLLWQIVMLKGNPFIASVWYVSHLSILPIYIALFGAKFVVCVMHKQHVSALTTFTAGISYEVIFIYFSIIVNSYLRTQDQDRYF